MVTIVVFLLARAVVVIIVVVVVEQSGSLAERAVLAVAVDAAAGKPNKVHAWVVYVCVPRLM